MRPVPEAPALKGILFLVFLTIPSQLLSQAVRTGTMREETIVLRCFDDDPEVMRAVDDFYNSSSPENQQRVFHILDEALGDWQARNIHTLTDILDAIGLHRLEAGRRYLVRFLNIDPAYDRAGLVQQAAAFSLARLGGKESFKVLSRAAEDRPNSDLGSVALALGLLGDRRAVPTLEKLARSADTETRQRAISALSKFCKPSSSG